jgi:hypothetical protein
MPPDSLVDSSSGKRILLSTLSMQQGNGGVCTVARMTAEALSHHHHVTAIACQDPGDYVVGNIDANAGRCQQIHETHAMRYLFKPEIEMIARTNGFEVLECCRWLNRQKPDTTCWNACFVARASE